MYIDTEKQLNKITDGLKQELLAAKAIDESGHAIDAKKFNEIIDKKIAQCNKILAATEKDGVTIDQYAANIAFTRIDRLNRMKESGIITPEAVWKGKEKIASEEPSSEKDKKIGAFNSGISKLFAKIQAAFRPSRTSENNR